MVQVEAVLADRYEMIGAEGGSGAFLARGGGNGAEQSPFGIEELPAVAGRADHLHPELAVGSDEDALDEGFRLRPARSPGIALRIRPLGNEFLEVPIPRRPFLIRNGLGRKGTFDYAQGIAVASAVTAIR